MTYRCCLYAGLATILVAVALTAIAAVLELDARWFIGAVIVGMYGCTSLLAYCVMRVNRPADEAFETGYEIGHDKGWRDCEERHAATVVPLRSVGNGVG